MFTNHGSKFTFSLKEMGKFFPKLGKFEGPGKVVFEAQPCADRSRWAKYEDNMFSEFVQR